MFFTRLWQKEKQILAKKSSGKQAFKTGIWRCKK